MTLSHVMNYVFTCTTKNCCRHLFQKKISIYFECGKAVSWNGFYPLAPKMAFFIAKAYKSHYETLSYFLMLYYTLSYYIILLSHFLIHFLILFLKLSHSFSYFHIPSHTFSSYCLILSSLSVLMPVNIQSCFPLKREKARCYQSLWLYCRKCDFEHWSNFSLKMLKKRSLGF